MESDVPSFAATAGGREARRHPRFAMPSPLPLAIDRCPTSAAELVNISWSGLGILADQFLGRPGERLIAETWDPAETARIVLPCQVRWALAEKEPPPYPMLRWLHGAVFIELDTPAQTLVRRLIRSPEQAPGNEPDPP